MLVLTRKKDQKIIIGKEHIVIKVVDIQANQIRLGIEAPKVVAIQREEIFNKQQKDNQS